MKKDRIFIIVGPTASGKTRAAVTLARDIGGEIISSDAMQVYEGMEILSQAPGKDEVAGVPYHLVSHVPPEEEYNAARFSEEASAIIKDIIKRDKVPILAGGTGLYVRALIDGLFPSPPKDNLLRERLERKVLEGPLLLHKELEEKDPESAAKIHPNDSRRIIRALEIYYLTGVPKSVHAKNTKGIGDEYEVVKAGIDPGRAELYRRIDERVDKMFCAGIVDEVQCLRKRKLSITASMALGIGEVSDHLEGKCSLDEAKELLKKNTRRYSKRQMTWFGADKRIRWFSDGEGVISYCRDIVQKG